MRRLIFLAFIGAFLTRNVALSKPHRSFPTNLAWLFDLKGKSNANKKQEAPTVCQTEECRQIAEIILKGMDKSVNPCDDFYEYACGKWPENNPVPTGMAEWSLWTMLQDNIDRQIQDILETESKADDLLVVKIAKKWYKTCMDTDAMDRQGLDPLIFTLSRIGGWPMTMDRDEWNEQEYSWQKVDDQYARLTGRNTFHDVRVHEGDLNDTEQIVQIDTPHLPPGSYILWAIMLPNEDSEEEGKKSDEDSSDEERQSHERKDSQEPENEDEHKPDEKDNDNDDDNDDDDDDDNDDSEDDDNDDSDDDDDDDDDDDSEDAKKRKSSNKLTRKKNRKSTHKEKRKNSDHTVKKHHHKTRKHRIKREIMMKANGKRAHRFIHRSKFNARQSKRKTLNAEDEHTTTTPRSTTEEMSDEEDYTMTIRQKYVDYISKVARAIIKVRGIEVSEKQIAEDVEDLMNFQLKLIDIVFEEGEDLEMTINDFQDWYDKKESKFADSQIDWVYKIEELFDEAGVSVDGDLNIQVDSPDYFEALVSLLDKTPTRTIVNYIHWNFISRMLQTTTKEMRELYDLWEDDKRKKDDEEDDKEDDEEIEDTERSTDCIEEVAMNDIIAYEYVRRHYSDEITKTALDMIDDIQKEVEYQIKESKWMNENTKDFILAKLVNMKRFVGYPNWYKNSTIVKQYYKGLMVGNSYYENILSFRRNHKWRELRKLENQDDTDIGIWQINPVTVQAFFIPEHNSITVTAADFQSPFFAYGRPQAINYGTIGFIMAHEVNHGFDDTGHLYDKNGDFMKWLSAMAEAYGKRAECFVNQFNKYPIDKKSDKKIENYGNQTAGENIADTMGLQAVFRAYRRRERECGKPDAALPGLEELTNDQLFFLAFSNLWCESTLYPQLDSNIVMRQAKMDEHSTGRLRVIGSVSNSDDFAKAFNCPVGSAMNPEKKCSIWEN